MSHLFRTEWILSFSYCLATVVFVLDITHSHATAQNASIEQLRQAATVAAIEKNKNFVVKLELFAEDPSHPKVGTGTLISKEGEIVTSAFLVNSKDTGVVAYWGDEKFNAALVGVDHSRNLALLKVKAPAGIKVPTIGAPRVEVGSTAIVLGKTFSVSSPNVSVGIVSAHNRIWGKAIQVDAKVSPANYGGPLIDLTGQITGILTPLSPENSGANPEDWYDSGIGFAIPIADVMSSVKRIKNAGDVQSGKIGIKFKSQNLFRNALQIGVCFPRSPAAKSGLLPGDHVTKIDGRPVVNLAQFKMSTASKYAGEEITVSVKRKGRELDLKLELTDQLLPYKFPYLGILPASEPQRGIVIKEVDRDLHQGTPLQAGQTITELDGQPVNSVDELSDLLAQKEAGDSIKLLVAQDDRTHTIQFKLRNIADPMKATAFPESATEQTENVKDESMTLGGYANHCHLVYRAETEKGGRAKALIVLAETSKSNKQALIDRWKQLVQSADVVVQIIFPDSIDGWSSEEKEVIELFRKKLSGRFANLESHMIYGSQKSAGLATNLVVERRDAYRGLILDTPNLDSMKVFPFSDPQHKLYTLIFSTKPGLVPSLRVSKRFELNLLPVKVEPQSSLDLTKSKSRSLARFIYLSDRL